MKSERMINSIPLRSSAPPRPFIKWAGGKTGLLDELACRLPSSWDRYHEPFLGGGAVFFFLARTVTTRGAFLSDVNAELINAYRAVKDEPGALLVELKRMDREHRKYARETREAHYNFVRASKPRGTIRRAARFIFLNKTCFNGLYRVNRNGGFNVLHGSYANPRICDEKTITAASEALRGARLEYARYEFAFELVGANDLVYIDPPYLGAFSQYSGDGFTRDDHARLADLCRDLDRRGAMFMLSNSNAARTLYNGFRVETVRAPRSISCKRDGRGRTGEIIVRNY